MTPTEISKGGLGDHDDFDLWPKKEVLRIEALSKQRVLSELQEIMEGCNYSWRRISELLQGQLDKGALEFTLIDGEILFEWNNLCEEKRRWERKGRLSNNSAEFNRDCLINLKILPFQAGLGLETTRLVTINIDESNYSATELCVGLEKLGFDSSTGGEDTESSDDDDTLSWVSIDSEGFEDIGESEDGEDFEGVEDSEEFEDLDVEDSEDSVDLEDGKDSEHVDFRDEDVQ